ncbi:MAG TPA: dTDP-4-amino-4,6-dideoxygalactose transaminase [Myxococcota bacterium]|nr:dTDP-4-amino-4,6-dideoxygalactose transaminase [Myxococcota bacterium]
MPGARIPFQRASLGAAERRAVERAVRQGALAGDGAIGRRVSARLRELTGARHVLLTPSATSASDVTFAALPVGPGEEVLMPSFAYPSQAAALLARGARPVFCDVDEATLNLDPADARRKVTKRTRALLVVHYAGVAADLTGLTRLAREAGLWLLEDAAHAIGARWRGRHLGSFGDAGWLSFHQTKNVVCGEGGALLLRSPALAARAEIVRQGGTNRAAFLRGEVSRYTWMGMGGSHLLSEVLAALLEVQLARLERLTRARRRIWELYHAGFAELEQAGSLRRPFVPPEAEHNAHLYFVRVADARMRDPLLRRLARAGIEASFHFQPLHASRFARRELGLRRARLPRTERAVRTLVRLPLWAGMTRAQGETVVETTRRFLRSGR